MDVESLGYHTDLMLRRLAGATVEDRGDHLVVTTAANPAFWWGNFLLLAEPPTDIEPWIATFQRAFPDATHLAIGVDGIEGTAGDTTGLVSEVAAVLTARYFLPRSPGAYQQTRTLESDQDWGAGRRAAAGLPRRAERAEPPRVRRAQGIARYQSVETQPEFRRGGLATQLVYKAGVHALAFLGAKTLVIVADPDDEAIRIYRSAGFVQRERQVQLCRAPQASE